MSKVVNLGVSAYGSVENCLDQFYDMHGEEEFNAVVIFATRGSEVIVGHSRENNFAVIGIIEKGKLILLDDIDNAVDLEQDQ